MDRDQVLAKVEEHDIKYVYLWFTDILGFLKSFAITLHELETALDEGMGFDGSSIEGFTRIQESDMIARPDPGTFAILPWQIDGHTVARMICDVYTPDMKPYDGDPRYVLRRTLEKAKERGYEFFVGPELEYFYFPSDTDPTPIDKGGYFDLLPLDVGSDLREQTIGRLDRMGIEVEYSHHEVAPSQHEIDLRYAEALRMADIVQTYKTVVKRTAYDRGLYATFMPKPIYGVNGSGMHCHQSLFEGGRNAFFEEDAEFHLSPTALHYIAGVLAHACEFAAITNQWVNSYKRLVPGYEAPIYVSWANANRSTMVRVPNIKPGKEKSTRIELRTPDPACNPYLAFAVMLAAGLDGIETDAEPPDPVENVNIYHLTDEERTEMGIESLPEDLGEAIRLAEESALVRETLGEHVFEQFIRNKRVIWQDSRARVTRQEVEYYLPIL
ncbi:MAG TPA: glutamine synthetase family protein [Gemmatimonadota bacterium]|nr:glutamine synthetase family protein [Gemmatimonadota bacterium]